MSNQASIAKNLPFRAPENVQKRHERIIELRGQGYPLKACAYGAGLKNHTTALYHVNGECRCKRNGVGS